MVLNARRQELIKLLESTIHNHPITIEKLANILGVGPRTIRYDLDIIEDELKKKSFKLHRKANKGIWVEVVDYNLVKNLLPNKLQESSYYALSKEERCNAIVVHILDNQEPVSIEYLANKLIVSRSTLVADLDSVRSFLEKYHLLLCSKRGLGLWSEGDEKSIRKILVDIFSTRIYGFGATNIRENYIFETELFHEYTRELPVKEIANTFINIIEKNNLPYNDFSINYMVLSLIVQLKRLNNGKYIANLSNINIAGCNSNLLHRLSTLIAVELSSYNEHFQDDFEISFITFQLLNSKISIVSDLGGNGENETKLWALNLTETFVKNCQTWLGDIYLDDEELINGLVLHLQPVVQRAKYGIKLNNPMLPQIREKYPELFMIALNAVKEIEQELGTELLDDEIGYLAIHLGAAIERKKVGLPKRLNVILVCANGIGTVKLLTITIKNRMPYLNIKKVVSVYELKQQDLSDIDLVISTIPLEIKDIAILHIPPILTDMEIQVIEKQIQYFYDKKFVPIDKSGSKKDMLTLKDVLLPETVDLDARVGSWEEAIQTAGKLLMDTGSVEACYIDRMINGVKQIGPYIVVAPGIAMPHARPEDGVKRICLSLVRLSDPISFGNFKYDPVDLVLAFGVIDADAHFRIFTELWEIMSDSRAVEVLRTCKDKAEIFALLDRYFAK
ncbi:phosphotransferase system eiib component type 2/3 [Lucifera butyrica]|uniref:Phosphotransferase system eiib component type 2/3 n=1 Tax=Lucifera butyrica TaxID=1351585 RepID=A0A498RFI8_9FIRM|nr:BglG family transcription antiterminator [Lucifera butyrica]VBB09717.1 phosphotransferase system eiib component type 2/3 [Lucifera butyrica]